MQILWDPLATVAPPGVCQDSRVYITWGQGVVPQITLNRQSLENFGYLSQEQREKG